MRIQRRRNANRNKVNIFYERKIRRCRKHAASDDVGKFGVDDVADVVMTFVYHVNFCFLHVESDRFKSCFGFFHRKRQTDVAQTADAYHDGLVRNLF